MQLSFRAHLTPSLAVNFVPVEVQNLSGVQKNSEALIIRLPFHASLRAKSEAKPRHDALQPYLLSLEILKGDNRPLHKTEGRPYNKPLEEKALDLLKRVPWAQSLNEAHIGTPAFPEGI